MRNRAKACACANFATAGSLILDPSDQSEKDEKMIKTFLTGLALASVMSAGAFAETFEVQMLNKGSDGERMVFEPAFVQAAPGDTIKFLATDRGHNAETVKGMIPEGAEGFAGKFNEEIEITLDTEGVYGVMCKPHFAMGMVMTIAVGDAETPEDFLEGRSPRKATERFEAQVGNL